MGSYFDKIDQFSVSLTKGVIRFRYLVIFLALIGMVLIGSGGRFLEFTNNYRVFFSEENPELTAFEELQSTYTKNDNILFVVEPADGDAFSKDTLSAIDYLTQEAWQIPFASRVDSVTNFQHTLGVDDDLLVEDLVYELATIPEDELTGKKQVALKEPLLKRQLITPDGKVTAVNVTLQYPEKSLTEVPQAVGHARELARYLEEAYPGMQVSLTGVSMLNNAFSEAGFNDVGSLIPLMFLVILVIALLILRSFFATIATMMVVLGSCMIGMGMAGFTGIKLTPISGSAPVVILTLAIADSIHVLISLRVAMREGLAKTEAIIEAIRLNFLPVTITSLTTVVGFLALNFSDSPPFWHLGNITAMGIIAAWILSLTLLPALIAVFPYKVKAEKSESSGQKAMESLANLVVKRARWLLMGIGGATFALILFIPNIEFNDQWVEYFDERIDFRTDSDQALKHFGMYPVEYSVPAKSQGGVSDPEFLAYLEKFTDYLRSRDDVAHVYSLSDIMKRLNKNLHGDDEAYYKTPDNRELSAQYLLLYELSLPYGLDLNDRVNITKSATRVTATLKNLSTAQTKQFLDETTLWINANLPDYMQAAKPTSAQVMFTYVTERNVDNMIAGTIIAILAISAIMMVALRNVRLGFLSLIPNGLPILATFGAWSILVGEVGFSVSTVASISLGIIVDDTVHFLSKYVRAKSEKMYSTADSIVYAFKSVGVAIIVNTIVLVIGFAVLTTSAFKLNADMGMLTVLAILFALILDFLFLPALLTVLDKDSKTDASNFDSETEDYMSNSVATESARALKSSSSA